MKGWIILTIIMISIVSVSAEDSPSFPINSSILSITNCYDKVYFQLKNSTLKVDDNEYRIAPECIGNTTDNFWACNCSDKFYVQTNLRTINNYTFESNYTTTYLIEEKSSSNGGGGRYTPPVNKSRNISITINNQTDLNIKLSDDNSKSINIILGHNLSIVPINVSMNNGTVEISFPENVSNESRQEIIKENEGFFQMILNFFENIWNWLVNLQW